MGLAGRLAGAAVLLAGLVLWPAAGVAVLFILGGDPAPWDPTLWVWMLAPHLVIAGGAALVAGPGSHRARLTRLAGGLSAAGHGLGLLVLLADDAAAASALPAFAVLLAGGAALALTSTPRPGTRGG